MNHNITFYSEHAAELVRQYDSIDSDKIHSAWLDLLPNKGNVLDVGAGSGRDARFMAKQGVKVIAVEPADELRMLAMSSTAEPSNIKWLDDSLPLLTRVFSLKLKFEMILVSALWMHLSDIEQESAIATLSELLLPHGKLVITLRYGTFNDVRTAYPVNIKTLKLLGSAHSLKVIRETAIEKDKLDRSAVTWQTLVFQKS